MNDDDTTDASLRASAYLDGELDPAETALAEAAPDVMAKVERLRGLQDEVRQVDAPSSAARDAAIAAALTEFDTVRRASPVVPFKRRPSYAGWLGVAAAVVAIGLVGVVIAQGTGGSDDDSAGFDQLAEEQTASDSAAGRVAAGEATAEALEAPAPAASDSAAESPATAAPAGTEAPAATELVLDAASTQAPSATEAPAAESGDTDTASATTTAAAGEAPTAFDPTVPVADEVELGIAGGRVLEDDAAGRLQPITNNPCGTDLDPRDFALADGLYVVDGVVTPVLIVVDRFGGTTTAFARDECILIASGSVP